MNTPDILRIKSILERTVSGTGTPLTSQHRAIIDSYAEPLARLMAEYGINTGLRQAHFFAQLAQESNQFRNTEENLKYSATRLMEIFPRYFRSSVEARNAAYDPVKIANTVYANRLGNGGPQSFDGYNFRGRGLIQLTGRDNYKAFLDHLRTLPSSCLDAATKAVLAKPGDNVVDLADLVSQRELAVRSACWFWVRNNINALADAGATDAAVTAVTRKVNGGTHGLSQRKVYFYRANLAIRSQS